MPFKERVENFNFEVTEEGITCIREFIRDTGGDVAALPALGSQLDITVPTDLSTNLDECYLRSLTLKQHIRSDGTADIWLARYSTSRAPAAGQIFPSPADATGPDFSVPEDKRGRTLKIGYQLVSVDDQNKAALKYDDDASVLNQPVQSLVVTMDLEVTDLTDNITNYATGVAARIGRIGTGGADDSKNWLYAGSECQEVIDGSTGLRYWTVTRHYVYKRVFLGIPQAGVVSTNSWNCIWQPGYGFRQLGTNYEIFPVVVAPNLFQDVMPCA